MNYPLISEYIEAIKAVEDNFEELTNLRSVLGDDGQPVMTSGNFAVVFMEDKKKVLLYALKFLGQEMSKGGCSSVGCTFYIFPMYKLGI